MASLLEKSIKISTAILLSVLFATGSVLSQTKGIPRILINPKGHSAKINNLLYTKDGSKIISISEDKSIRVWDTETGDILQKFESQIDDGAAGMFYTSAISPNGRLLAVAGYPVPGSEENHIIIIDLEKGVQISTAIGHYNVINGLDFTGDGRFLVSGGDDGLINIWKVNRSKKYTSVAQIDVGLPVFSLSVNSLTNDIAISTQSRDVWVYDISGIDRGNNFPKTTLKGHKDLVNKVVYSPDGHYLSSCSYNNEVIVWGNKGEQIFMKDEYPTVVNALAFSNDGRVLVALDIQGNGYSYAVPTGNLYTDEFHGHNNTVFSAIFSPNSSDGNYVIASTGGTRNEIVIWNAISAKNIRTISGKGNFIGGLAFGVGMELFISPEFGVDKKPDYTYSFDFHNFTIKNNPGKPRISAERENRLLRSLSYGNDPYTLKLPRGKEIINDPAQDGIIRTYDVTLDDKIIVGSDFSLKLYNIDGNIEKEFIGHTGGVWSLAVSPDGRYFTSGSEDQTIRLWKLDETGHAPSMLDYFENDPEILEILESLKMDSLVRDDSRVSWEKAIEVIGNNYDRRTTGYFQDIFNNLGETVIPFANLFVADDGEWICWTPTGYFSSSTSGADYFGWHINNGIEKLAEFYSAEQYFEILYRPQVLARSIAQGKRVKTILKEDGEKIFDLSKLNRPSAGFFNINSLTIGNEKTLDYEKGKYHTTDNKIALSVDIYDGGGGIREVNIYHNGKLIKHDTDLKSIQESAHFTKTYEVDLVNETNNFKVVVINYQSIESRPDYLKIEYVGEKIVTSRLHVLSIGINKYKKEEYNLNYARSDAKSFTDKFVKNARSMFKTVRNRIELYDTDATKENIVKAFESIISQANPEDMFVFYYAGHGSINEDTYEYFLVPTDVTQLYGDPEQLAEKGISANELKTLLSRVKCTKQLILMDACHSGAAVEAFQDDEGSREKAITHLARSSGVAMLTSSNSQQFATEFEVLKHGVFTYSLLEAMDGEADTGDDQVSVYELKLYMERMVPQLSEKYGGESQRPIAHVFGNDFPLVAVEKEDETTPADGGGE